MKTKHQQSLDALRAQSSDWIKRSAGTPNGFMSRFIIRLHYVVLRERGALS